VIAPDGIQVGVPVSLKGPPPGTPLAEVGADFADLPQPKEVRTATGKTTAVSLIASLVLTHRRSDPRYRAMKNPPPEHAAVGHFERSRWTDEAWTDTDGLARALDAGAVLLQTPASFKASTEHATRLENFVAHAMRPQVSLAWEWMKGSWPDRKALDLVAQTAESLGCADRCRLIAADVLTWLRRGPEEAVTADIALLDAPYRDEQLEDALRLLGDRPPALVVCEHHRRRRLNERIGREAVRRIFVVLAADD